MLVIKPYLRENALLYANRFALSQNPIFGNFAGIGGNCTNFVSQCIYAGSCKMNYKPTFGWYYISMNERAPAWTGVDYFYNFITKNTDVGPFGRDATPDELEVGDVIQLGREGEGFYHTLIIIGFEGDDPLIAAQTDNALGRALSTYTYDFARYIKILGVRLDTPTNDDCFESVYNGIAIIEDQSATAPMPSPSTTQTPAPSPAPAPAPTPAQPAEPTPTPEAAPEPTPEAAPEPTPQS